MVVVVGASFILGCRFVLNSCNPRALDKKIQCLYSTRSRRISQSRVVCLLWLGLVSRISIEILNALTSYTRERWQREHLWTGLMVKHLKAGLRKLYSHTYSYTIRRLRLLQPREDPP